MRTGPYPTIRFVALRGRIVDHKWHRDSGWDDEERRARLKFESSHRPAPTANPVIEGKTAAEGRSVSRDLEPVAADVDRCRDEVLAWKSKVARLSAEHRKALSEAEMSSRNSVPGSLETRQAKSARLAAELSRALAKLSVARLALARVAPNDPLLHPDSARP